MPKSDGTPLLAKNVDLGPALPLTAWRKVAIGTWRSAGDPSVYGIIEADVAKVVATIERLKQETGCKITLSHFVGRALAEVFARHPEINAILRWGKIYPRRNVDIFYQVATDDQGKDLSGMTIRNADRKTIPEIAREMQEDVERIRTKGDPAYRKMKGTMGLFPGFLAGTVIHLTGLLMYGFNLWSSLLGLPRDPFGSAMVTNIGSLGLDMAFAPLVPYSRVPLLVAVGQVRDTPVVRDGKIAIAPICKLCITFDHRLIDGVHAARMTRTFLQILEDPDSQLGAVPSR